MEISDCPNVTMDIILSVFKNKNDEKKLKDIKNSVSALLRSDEDSLFDEFGEIIDHQVEDLIKYDRKKGEESLLKYNKGRYKRRPKANKPGGADPILQAKDFTGKAGECAVMSELLFRGFNVNRMMVDGGIDLVAFKEGNYFFY